MCAPRDQRKSSNNQREQAELNALRCQLRADVSGEGDLVRQAANLRWSIAEGSIRGMSEELLFPPCGMSGQSST